jgi:ABC-type nickel/cobalt efflux system permease component RcnA
MDLELLYRPVEHLDGWLSGALAGAPLLVALAIALLLGLRHASDPDHLVAVTSLVAGRDGDVSSGVRLGAWWGLGHALVLLLVGAPLIVLRGHLPAWVEHVAEQAIGLAIVALAARVLFKWVRGDYRLTSHRHAATAGGDDHRHLHEAPSAHRHAHDRTPSQSFAIGALHGLGGSGAVAVLLLSALPTTTEALAALALFAPAAMLSMTLLTGACSWALTRQVIAPLYRSALIPALGLFGILFGASYAGLA